MANLKRIGCSVSIAAMASASAHLAVAQVDRRVLPIPTPEFTGVIGETVETSAPGASYSVAAPKAAPNIFLFMSDDTGFAMSSTFGGPVPTPNMDRLATMGQRYNRFHTTGVCSPSRAALLTGRNHHNSGVGYLVDMPTQFPGYVGRISPATGTIAQVLRLNGYNTAMFGKHHNVPHGEDTAAGPFDMWPSGLGFEYFYGFIGGDTDQWHPGLYRGTSRLREDSGGQVTLDRRLADDAILWIHDQKAAAPDKPFLVYLAPGSTHAPHQAPKNYIERFRGRFDKGWDLVREETYHRQLDEGIIPPGTRLTPRPAAIPAWSSLSPRERRFASRSMEVAAAMLAYQDAQLGRILDELERMHQFDNTLFIIVQGDNGASADAGPDGAANVWAKINGVPESAADLARSVDTLGGESSQANYPAGWGWAMNTPFRWTKQYASMLGGIRNGLIMAWAEHVRRPNSVCSQFGHLVDIVPTILEAANVPEPVTLYGIPQKALDGESLLSSLSACEPDRPRSQYFEIGGKIGFYQDGWFASRDDGRLPWQALPPDAGNVGARWELYDLNKDFSQSTDISARDPKKLKELVHLWDKAARRNNVYPLDNRFAGARMDAYRHPRQRLEFWGAGSSIPAYSLRNLAGRSFQLTAELELDAADGSGVIAAIGSHFAGWSLYLDHGKPVFIYALSTRPADIVRLVAERPLPKGQTKLRLKFDSMGLHQAANVTLSAGNVDLLRGRIPRTYVMAAGMGEMLDIGRDTGGQVTKYPFQSVTFSGRIDYVNIEFSE